MAKLIPFKPSMLKQMGIVSTKKGLMIDGSRLSKPIDKSKLTDNKKFVKQEKPEVKQLNKEVKEQAKQKPKMSAAERAHNEARGLY